MKFLILAAFLSLPAFAQTDADQAALFQKAKADTLSNIDQRINNLNTAKSCVNSAADGKALHNCHEQLQESMKTLRGNIQDQRKTMRASRDEMRSKKRAERESKKSN